MSQRIVRYSNAVRTATDPGNEHGRLALVISANSTSADVVSATEKPRPKARSRACRFPEFLLDGVAVAHDVIVQAAVPLGLTSNFESHGSMCRWGWESGRGCCAVRS
jgi:hypothetical protein